MAFVEKGFEVVKILVTQGLGGLWTWVLEKVGDIKEMVMSQVKEMVVTQIVKAGITWLISMLNPAGAFIKACKMIYDVVMFFVEKAAQIKEFVDAVLDSVESIAGGGVGAVASKIENTLAKMLPVLIGFLASLLGLGGIADKIKKIIETIQKPIAKVVDWVVGKAVAFGTKFLAGAKRLGGKLKAKLGIKDETPVQKQARLDRGMAAAREVGRRFAGKPVGKQVLGPLLAVVRLRHRMTSLELVEKSGHWAVRGTVNPTAEETLEAELADPKYEEQFAKAVAQANVRLAKEKPPRTIAAADLAEARRVVAPTGRRAAGSLAKWVQDLYTYFRDPNPEKVDTVATVASNGVAPGLVANLSQKFTRLAAQTLDTAQTELNEHYRPGATKGDKSSAYLVVAEQVFVQLLARPQTCVDDLQRWHGMLGEPACYVGDADRLAHVEDQGFAATTDGPGIDGEAHGLLHRHEVAGDLRVGDGDRAAGVGLGAEGDEYGATRTEHVPESHRYVGAVGLAALLGGEAFGDALRVAQHAGGFGSLVGTDVHEPNRSHGRGRGEHVGGAQHVGLPPLVGVRLQQRQVLQRRCVKHHLRLELLEQLDQPRAIADVGQQQVRVVEHRRVVDGQLYGVQTALVAIQHHQRRRFEPVQLPAQLAPDRAAGTRDQHAAAGDVVSDRAGVDVGRVATEQVFGRHRADVGERDRTEHLVGLRQHQEGEADLVGGRRHVADQFAVGAGDGQQDMSRLHPLGDLGQVVERALHSEPLETKVPFVGVVVEERHRLVRAGSIGGQRADDLVRAVTGAEDDQAQAPRATAPLVAEQAPRRSQRHGAGSGERRGERRHGPRQLAAADLECDDGERNAREQHRDPEREQLVETAVAPPAAIQAGGEAEDALADDGNHHREGEPGPRHRPQLEVVAQDGGEGDGEGPHERIDSEVDER